MTPELRKTQGSLPRAQPLPSAPGTAAAPLLGRRARPQPQSELRAVVGYAGDAGDAMAGRCKHGKRCGKWMENDGKIWKIYIDGLDGKSHSGW